VPPSSLSDGGPPPPDTRGCEPGTIDANGDPADGCECIPTAPSEELCDGFDNDCDQRTMDGVEDPGIGVPCDGSDDDLCEEGVWVCTGGRAVCEDPTGNIREECNATDDDCDGMVDEEAGMQLHLDADGDGYGRDDDFVFSCDAIPGREPRGGDCNDENAAVNPARPEMCDTNDDDCDGVIDEEGGCDCVGLIEGDRLYAFCSPELNWYDARDGCTGGGMQLASLETDAEDAFVVATLRARGLAPAWVGLHDEGHEARWHWVDEMPISRMAWGPGEPNNDDGSIAFSDEDCAVVGWYGDPNTWNDRNCGVGHRFVCEGPAP